MNLSILKNSVEVANVEIDANTVFSQKLMGEHKISSVFYTVAPLSITIGDYIEHKGNKYYINRPPVVEKISTINYKYTIEFEADVYTLYNKLFMDEGSADFSYHGTASDHLTLLLTNINTISAGFTVAEVDSTESVTITYTNQNCRTALNTIAETFELEYILVGKAITMKKVISENTIIDLEYGRGKGLYTLTRGAVNDENLVTRVYGFGSTKNIDYTYRGGKKRLVFDDLYLENNISLYGVREGVFTDEDIYPSFTGTITSTADETTITDTSIDFDVNSYLMEGVVASIVFKTGDLAGNTFELKENGGYDHATKTIRFKINEEENDYDLPNATVKPQVGDEFTLINITMPQSYIDNAESDLEAKTLEYLTENSQPKVTYNLSVDEKFVRDNGLDFQVGFKVSLVDTDLGVDTDIRISEINYPLDNEDLIKVTISDQVNYSVAERVIKQTVENKVVTGQVDRTQAENYRKAVNRTRELQGLITSLEADMLVIGSDAFGLNNVRIEVNAGGNENTINISAGSLLHYEIEIDGLGYIWSLPLASFNTLVPANAYYVYAKCSKTALTGTWYISSTPKELEEETGYYLFRLGVVYSVADGRRDFKFTKGMTYIVGDTITTGKIESLDSLNFFDLNGNKFRMGNATDYIEWNGVKLSVTKAEIGDCIITGNAWADGANVGNWLIDGGKITSEANNSGVPVMTLDSLNGSIVIKDPEGRTSGISDDGMFSGAANLPMNNGSNVSRTSILGIGDKFVTTPIASYNFLAGVSGVVRGTGDFWKYGVYGNHEGQADAYGGYFKDLFAHGLNLSFTVVPSGSTSKTITRSEVCIFCYNTSSATIYLPASPNLGQVHYVKRVSSSVEISGNGNNLFTDASYPSIAINKGDIAMLMFDGTYWHASRSWWN